jgi:hypothetical protein
VTALDLESLVAIDVHVHVEQDLHGHLSMDDELLTAVDAQLPLAPDALVAVEHRRGTEPFQATLTKLKHTRRAEYGEVWISFFIHEAA